MSDTKHVIPPLTHVMVDAFALRELLMAVLDTSGVQLRELQALRRPPSAELLGLRDPIGTLSAEYNAALQAHIALHQP